MTPRHPFCDSRGEPVTAVTDRTVVAGDVDEFNVALPKMHGALYRVQGGGVDSVVAVRDHGTLQVGHISIGYPMVGTVDVDDSVVTVAMVLESPEGAKWDGVDLRRGHVVMYGPGGHHQAVDVGGMAIGFAVIDLDCLDEAVNDLGRRGTSREQGVFRPDLARDVMRTFEREAFSDDSSMLLGAVASAVSTPGATLQRDSSKRVSSELIVRRAVDHVHDTDDWLPSSLTLCRAAGVSERRLQMAFLEIYRMSPSRFFRKRALSIARIRLAQTDGVASPVTHVAMDLGFRHFGRFSRYYFDQFGELPSTTAAGAGTGR
jgi:AraC-like DNA-binding protein